MMWSMLLGVHWFMGRWARGVGPMEFVWLTWGLCWSRHCGYSESNSRQAPTQGGKLLRPEVFSGERMLEKNAQLRKGWTNHLNQTSRSCILFAAKGVNLVGLWSSNFSHLWEKLQHLITHQSQKTRPTILFQEKSNAFQKDRFPWSINFHESCEVFGCKALANQGVFIADGQRWEFLGPTRHGVRSL